MIEIIIDAIFVSIYNKKNKLCNMCVYDLVDVQEHKHFKPHDLCVIHIHFAYFLSLPISKSTS